MDENVITDLKQFISGEISQGFLLQNQELDKKLKQFATKDDLQQLKDDLQQAKDDLSGQITDLSASVAIALDDTTDTTDTQLKDHERRITSLETKTA